MSERLAELRNRLQQLAADERSGALSTAAYDEARAPLEREIVAMVMEGTAEAVAPGATTVNSAHASLSAASASAASASASASSTPSAATVVGGAAAMLATPAAPRPSVRLRLGLAAAIVVLAAVGYAVTGSPQLARLQAFGPPAPGPDAGTAPGGEPQVTRAQIETMVERLAQRMKERPDDAQGWLMLGRAYSVLGRHEEALPAYARAASLRPEDATTLADYADAIGVHNGGHADAQSDALVAKALTLEPANPKALALAGTAAFDRADYAGAVQQWQKMAAALAPDDPDRQRVEASIAEARQRGNLPVAAIDSARPPAPDASAAKGGTDAAIDSSVSGTVSLAPALAARAAPDDTVFIFARAAAGPRMPLAVLRAKVKDLPMRYRLDDSMAMAPTAKISGAHQVVVGARVSKSGNAMPQAGDLAGESEPVVPGAREVTVTIAGAVGP